MPNDHKKTLRTKDNIILYSSSVLLDKPEAILFIPIEHNRALAGTIRLQFIDDAHDKETRIKSEPDGKYLNLTCYNFSNNGRENWTVDPIEIGTIEGNKVSLQLYSKLMGVEKRMRLVVFTLFERVINNESTSV